MRTPGYKYSEVTEKIIVVEIKAVSVLTDAHLAQALNYL